MKVSLVLLLSLSLSLDIYGQGSRVPLIIKGNIRNNTGNLYIPITSPSGIVTTDTIKVDPGGNFYYKTSKCETPQKTYLWNVALSLNNLMIAPGYALTITADAKDYKTLSATTSITGKGACVNQYRKKVFELYLSGRDSLGFESSIDADTTIRLPLILNSYYLRDSLINVVFNNCRDPYAAFFRKLEYNNNFYTRHAGILQMARDNSFEGSAYQSFVKRYIPNEILSKPGNDQLLISDAYVMFLGYYINHEKRLADLNDKAAHTNNTDFKTDFITHHFHGKVREFLLYKRYEYAIMQSTSLEELTNKKQQLNPLIEAYVGKAKKAVIHSYYNSRYRYFRATRTGSQAPDFSLKDNKDNLYHLADFKGKVVFIDFWASWCIPCRNETPAMKALYEKYKAQKALQVISIAVGDKKEHWLKAVEQDKMEWLQLRDEEGALQKSYNTNAIPRFALIGKNGRIISINAPRPSNASELIPLIEKALQ